MTAAVFSFILTAFSLHSHHRILIAFLFAIIHLQDAMSSSKEIQILTKINDKSEQLKTQGLTVDDEALLKSRLKFIWGKDVDGTDSTACRQGTDSTAYRQSRARRNYGKIQDKDKHLFLAFVLVIPPTVCSSKETGKSIDVICRITHCRQYHVNLSNAAKDFFESIASQNQ